MKIFNILIFIVLFVCGAVNAESSQVRLKDIAHILEARDNQIMGFGLVVGLNNSGDRMQNSYTQQAIANLMSRMGVVPQSVDFKTRNVAAVMVTANLPPFVKQGQKIDVTVSSVGDAVSLQGGTLLITPLQGADDQVYAVAQGSMVVGLLPQTPNVPYVKQRQVTTGRISGGGIVEKEIPVTLVNKNVLTIVINEPDFTTAKRMAASLKEEGINAEAKDAGTVQIGISGDENLVELISQVENVRITPDSIARIVINERTGTIVMGENVVIAPCAVSFSGIDVVIKDMNLYSEGTLDYEGANDDRYWARSYAKLNKDEGKMVALPPMPTLSKLVKALNSIGATPKDMMAIIQAMKKSGAIKAELEII
ncbi:MAG: flagellar basal body P-ring protein FlgI [Candidatus Margulisiibacteriota bacterium]